jgi:dihydroorotate dehydrogenase
MLDCASVSPKVMVPPHTRLQLLSPSRIRVPQPPRSRTTASQIARRFASSTTQRSESLFLGRLKAAIYTSALGTSLLALYFYTTDTRAFVHRYVVPPLLRLTLPDAEDAHHAGTTVLGALYAVGLHPRDRTKDEHALATEVFGQKLSNPLGISAGLDKDAEIPDALFALGAAVVEVGGCTPAPQAGNPRPRVWRVPSLDGMINRYGLNSRGADAMAARLRARLGRFARSIGATEADVLHGRAGVPPGSLAEGKLLAVQVAKGKETDERDFDAVVADYVYCVRRLGLFADVLVVNVSSPNTPGLRDLQAVEPLTRILSAVVDEAQKTSRRHRPKVMVKVSPDEDSDSQVEGICQAIWESGVDGVIVGNTTRRRTGLAPEGVILSGREQRTLLEMGGYSGPALFGQTVQLVGRYRKMLDRQSFRAEPPAPIAASGLPAVDGIISGPAETQTGPSEQKVIFASGGITNGQQALAVLNAGASVAMVYTGMVYGGAGTVTRLKGEIRDEVKRSPA